MKKFFVIFAAISSMVALGGCSEQVMNDEMAEGESLLRVMTRGETPPQEANVYVMNSNGNCMRLLTTNEGEQQASTHLIAGTYTVYAVGGEDLGAFSLPDRDDATANSEIIVAEGETMGDLLMKSSSVTLTQGNQSNLELELERQVIKVNEVTIKEVPTDVTKVEVSISPLYQGVQLDGTRTGSTYITLELTKSSDNKTWTNGVNQPYCFPSDGNPYITVAFTRGSEERRYSYQASEPFEANHQVSIEGTYSEDALLSTSLTMQDWDTEKNETFGFSEDNLVTLLGYYVVSVNSSYRTAVLLRKGQDNGYTSAEQVATKGESINKPEGVTCGEWRLPTVEECQTFLEDPTVNLKKYDEWYYCLNGSTLKKMKAGQSSTGEITVEGPLDTDYDSNIYYRPVIDIQY